MEKENLTNSGYNLANLMRRFIERQTGMKISKNAPRADMIKCLMMQKFGLSENAIKPKSQCLNQRPQLIYEHYTTKFTIKYGDYDIDIITAEDNSGFLMLKTKLGTNQQDPFCLRPIYQPAPPKGYFNPLIKFFDEITGRKKLIDFKFIPEENQKYYKRGDLFVFSENHLWEGDEQTATQIVEDLYHQRFDSSVSGPFFEAKYNNGYASTKLELYVWDQMRRQAQARGKE